jgi:hypothetical protein
MAVVADEVAHARLLLVEVETADSLVHGEVRQYGPFGLALVLGERGHQVGLEVALVILEVAGEQPVDCPVAEASQRVHRLREGVRLLARDPVLDDHEHRAIIGRHGAGHVVAWPWGRREVEPLRRPEP